MKEIMMMINPFKEDVGDISKKLYVIKNYLALL